MLLGVVLARCLVLYLKFIKIDVDKYSEIARKYGVMSIPTVILFKDGMEVKRYTGFMARDQFDDFLK